MLFQVSPIVLIFALAGVFAALIATLSWRRRAQPEAGVFTWLMLAVTLWALAESVENGIADLEVKLAFARLSHFGIQAVAPLFLIFALHLTQRSAMLTPRRRALLWVVPLVALLLVLTNDWHRLFWQQVSLRTLTTGYDIHFVYGPLFWTAAIYHFGLLSLAVSLLIAFFLDQRDLYRRQALIVMTAVLLPGITTVLYVFQLNTFPGIDWTPVAFVVTGLLMVYAIARLQLFDLVPVARDLLVVKTPDALLVVDDRGQVVDANPAAYTLLPVAHWLVGSKVDAVLPPGAGIRELLAEAGDSHACLAVPRGDQAQWLEVRCTRLLNHEGSCSGHLLLIRDVTASQLAMHDLRVARDAARAAIRAKDGFLATMSHELRTPLTGVLGLTEALQSEALGTLNTRQHHALAVIERSGRRLSNLIGAILDLSSMEAGDIRINEQVLPAAELCARCVESVRDEADRRSHRIACTVRPADLVVRVDLRRMAEALGYLLDNAAKFMPDGGELGLEVSSDGTGGVAFTVWDKGIGVAPEDQSIIFEPFVQADDGLTRHYGGAGIGLALAHRLVLLHGGQIEVESTPGQGSRFTVRLPRAQVSLPMHRQAA